MGWGNKEYWIWKLKGRLVGMFLTDVRKWNPAKVIRKDKQSNFPHKFPKSSRYIWMWGKREGVVEKKDFMEVELRRNQILERIKLGNVSPLLWQMVKLSFLGTITQVLGLGQQEKRHQTSPPSFPNVFLGASTHASDLQRTEQSTFVEVALKERQDMHIGGFQNKQTSRTFTGLWPQPQATNCKQDKPCCYSETLKASTRIKH